MTIAAGGTCAFTSAPLPLDLSLGTDSLFSKSIDNITLKNNDDDVASIGFNNFRLGDQSGRSTCLDTLLSDPTEYLSDSKTRNT